MEGENQMKKLMIAFAMFSMLHLTGTSSFAIVECGDVYPPDSFPGGGDCGDGVVNEFDILEEIDFYLGLTEPTECQKARADMPNGKPPYCGNPAGSPNCESDGMINIFDVLVVNDKALGQANCCDYCNQSTEDSDGDGIIDSLDNCPETPNGTDMGTCAKTISGVVIGTEIACTDNGYCGTGEICQMEQSDWNQNGIGDVCECYADCNCDKIINSADLLILKQEFDRNDCENNLCQADCNANGKVDFSDLKIMKVQYFRDDCPLCP
jgi:hypothetical protein